MSSLKWANRADSLLGDPMPAKGNKPPKQATTSLHGGRGTADPRHTAHAIHIDPWTSALAATLREGHSVRAKRRKSGVQKATEKVVLSLGKANGRLLTVLGLSYPAERGLGLGLGLWRQTLQLLVLELAASPKWGAGVVTGECSGGPCPRSGGEEENIPNGCTLTVQAQHSPQLAQTGQRDRPPLVASSTQQSPETRSNQGVTVASQRKKAGCAPPHHQPEAKSAASSCSSSSACHPSPTTSQRCMSEDDRPIVVADERRRRLEQVAADVFAAVSFERLALKDADDVGQLAAGVAAATRLETLSKH